MIHPGVFMYTDANNSPLTQHLFIKIYIQLHVSAKLRHPKPEDSRNM